MNRFVLLVGLTIMDLCWMYPWSLLFGTWLTPDRPRALLSPASMLGLLLVAALATQGVVRSIGGRRAGQALLIGLGLVAIALCVRIDQFPSSDGVGWLDLLVREMAVLLGRPTAAAMAAALGIVLWWRGVGIGTRGLSFPEVESSFRWGIAALVIAAILLAVGNQAAVRLDLEGQAAPFVVGFMFVSLLTLALARLESLRSHARALRLNTQWLGVLIGVAGVLVLTALVVAQVLSFDLLVAATQPVFNLLGFVLLVLLLVIIVPMAYVVELIVYLLMQLLQPDPNRPPPELLQSGEVEDFLRRMFAQVLAPEVLDAARAIGVVLLLGVALLLVARTVAGWRPASSLVDGTDEERDTLWEPTRVRRALLAWLRRLFRRNVQREVQPDSVAAVSETASEARASSVRELYRRLLRLGTHAGATRAPADTPFEHLPILERRLEPVDDLEQLTDAYVLARYAELPPQDGEVQALAERLERIQNRIEDEPTTEP